MKLIKRKPCKFPCCRDELITARRELSGGRSTSTKEETMFTKKHFEIIARVLREVSENINPEASTDLTLALVRIKFIEVFQTNPNFDSIRFTGASIPLGKKKKL